jgi:MFS transporter, UMF1 family
MPVVSAISAIDTVAWANDEKKNRHVGEIAPRDPVLKYVPRLFKFDRAPIEASGLSVDVYARATILMSSLFLGPALLQLASNEAEAYCLLGDDPSIGNDSILMDACLAGAKVHGFKPSSLLSNIAVAAGLLGAVILPPFGAIVDYTSYRKHVGVISAMLLTLVKGIEISVSQDTWFLIACLQILSGILYSIHLASIYAYKSELSEDPTEQTKYNIYYFVVLYFSTLVFMTQVLIFAFLLDASDVGTARIALMITTATCAIAFSLAWMFLFRNRPPLSLVEDDKTVLLSGFIKLYQTSKRIQKELPALRWFMLSLVFSESANTTLVTIATTYMSHFLRMDGKDIGAVFLTVLLMGIPGSKIGEFIALRWNPVTSAKICDFLYIVVTSAAAITLTGPERAHLTLIFGALWGICLGKCTSSLLVREE